MPSNNSQPQRSTQNFKTACNRTIALTPKSLAHLQAHPDVMSVLPEAIAKARLPGGNFVQVEVDLGRTIGVENRVATTPCELTTPIQFAVRKGRAKPTRVLPAGTAGEQTSSVAVLVTQSREDPQAYALVTAWLGKLAQKEPWDPMIKSAAEYQNCVNFWCSNALIHDPEVMGEIFTSTWEEVIGQPRPFA